MPGRDIHVVRRGDGTWAVEREGGDRASSLHGTQQDAIDSARPLARQDGVELFIHRPDGRIRDRDSHGNDPFPPRG